MRKIFFLATFLFCFFSRAQDFAVKVEVVKNIKISAATRDSYVVPASEIWHVELTDGTKWQNNGGAGWVEETGGGVTDGDKGDITVASENWTIDNGVVTEPKLSTTVNASLDLADSALQSGDNVSELVNDVGYITEGGNLIPVTQAEYDLLSPTEISENDYAIVDEDDGSSPGGGATQLSELSDVNTSTPANRNVLVADGVDWESRPLVEEDISDFGDYVALTGSQNIAGLKTMTSAFTASAGITTNQVYFTPTSTEPSSFEGMFYYSSVEDGIMVRDNVGFKRLAFADEIVSGSTDLSYTPSATDGTVTSDTGTDATIPAGSTTNASLMLPGDKTKLNGIESGADVTDTANVTAAGALMDSEVDADIKTLALPANTTISAFGASLIDDAANTNARTTLGLGSSATAALIDDDTFSTATSSNIPSAESVKAYVDANASSGLTDEQVQDIAGAMWTGNTESGASVTYQDGDGTMDITIAAGTTNIVDGAVTESKLNSAFYDTGTFTPTLIDSGGGATYSATTTVGRWIRVGDFVQLTIEFFNIDTTGTPTGTLYVGNLPFYPTISYEGYGNVLIDGFVADGIAGATLLSKHIVAEANGNQIFIYIDVSSSNVMHSIDTVTFTEGMLRLSIGSY